MKQYLISIIVVAIAITSLVCAGPAYDKWSSRMPTYATPTIKEYDKLIADLDKGKAELKKEREGLLRPEDKGTYVSVWALWQSMTEVESYAGSRHWRRIPDSWSGLLAYSEFKAWLDKAREIDREAGNPSLDEVVIIGGISFGIEKE